LRKRYPVIEEQCCDEGDGAHDLVSSETCRTPLWQGKGGLISGRRMAAMANCDRTRSLRTLPAPAANAAARPCRFPFDKIKIDRCFVDDIAETKGSSSIVQAVINIAEARRMTTTAEGVESEQQKEILRALGCTEMQGILFNQPLMVAEIRTMLSQANLAAAA
jgi:hypothetical protein